MRYRISLSLFLSLIAILFLFHSLHAEEGFFFPDDLEIAPDTIEVAYTATIAFPSGWSNCSAAYISPDGYLLTAYHCFFKAVNLDDAFSQNLARGVTVVDIPLEEVVGMRYEVDNFSSTVVAAGYGDSIFDERLIHTYEPSVLATIADLTSTDWMILKVDDVQNHSCIIAATKSPNEGDYTWTIGYPGVTKREVGEETDNLTKLVSFGRVAYSADETEAYKTLNPLNRRLVLDFWRNLIDRGEYFITDSDSKGGNSGSPVINHESELVGILVDGLLPSPGLAYKKYLTYTSGVIDLRTIYESLGIDDFNTFFSCENR